ncbi:MAG: hypothetical protein HGA78_06850 [Nitrospirales bacterium]|nr:hypothetical protein [Nitrospirales bacterium]
MIRHTFSMLNGIGEKLERQLWSMGILTWDDFCGRDEIEGISPERKRFYDEQLLHLSQELSKGNAEYFSRVLKRREHWRLFETFRDRALCLDIETNGLQPDNGGYVTVVGLYDGYDCKCFVRGDNLTVDNLNREMASCRMLITFYGSTFDVPFLFRSLPGVKFFVPHFDLCHASRSLGIMGGLKRLEEMFGIERDDAVRGMNGYDAVKLWDSARRGSYEARERLLTYNREDTKNLMNLAQIIYQRMKVATGIEEYLVCGAA